MSTPDVSTAPARIPQLAVLTLDERWTAWQARGEAHDQSVRLKLAIAAPIALVIGAASLYLLFAR